MPRFPPWTDRVVRASLVLVGALALGGPLLLMAWVRTPYVTGQGRAPAQPVTFDHRHHVRDDGIDCLYCHTTATRSASAGMPATELCLSCHNQIWSDSPLLAAVWHSYVDNTPIVWLRVTNLPDFVFFNHAIHTTNGIGCETCHGRIDLMARVFQAKPMTMGWCLECHRSPARHVRPLDAVTAMGWRPTVTGITRASHVYPLRQPTHCTACHR